MLLEGMLARDFPAAFGEITESNLFFAASVQHGLLHRVGQFLPRRIDIDAVVFGQRQDQLEVMRVASIPTTYRAAGQR